MPSLAIHSRKLPSKTPPPTWFNTEMELSSVKNGKVQSTLYASPIDFIKLSPRGAYTTALVKSHYQVVDWDTHVQRVIKSIAALHTSLEGYFSHYYDSIDAAQEAEAVQRAMLPSVLACLQAAAKLQQPPETLMLTVLLCPAILRPLDVHAFAWPYTAALPADGTAWAVVLGQPRQVPIGKDTAWVTQRQRLEELRPEGASEVLLCTKEGALLEGLVTNFFVVADDGGGGAAVLTAGMAEGVVWGTMRQRVLQACEELALRVREGGVDAGERGAWREAFITNSLRMVQPLGAITCDEDNLWGLPPWKVCFEGGPGPWTSRIRDKVAALLPVRDVRQLGAG